MDQGLIDKARDLLNANYISTTLSTVDRGYNVNIAVISVIEMINDTTILCARFGADKTYANLKETGKGVFMVLLTDNERSKDGIRVYVEMQDDLVSGEYYDRIRRRMDVSNYSNFPLRNCLLFKIIDILPVSMLKPADQ